jgi:hypothetical protein
VRSRKRGPAVRRGNYGMMQGYRTSRAKLFVSPAKCEAGLS